MKIKDLIIAIETNDFTKLQNIEAIKFIIGQDQICLYSGKGTGVVISLKQALENFSTDTLIKSIINDGCVAKELTSLPYIIKAKRQLLSLSINELSSISKIEPIILEKIENNCRVKIKDILTLCKMLKIKELSSISALI